MSSTQGLRLSDLVREIPGHPSLSGDPDVIVRGVRHDSRRVEPGDLFVARKGASADGSRFIEQARERGAVALLVARDAATPEAHEGGAALPRIVVDDAGEGLAFAAAAVYGHPSFSLEVVGITGTNGKTTTTHLVRALLDGAAGKPRCGIIGTVGHSFGDVRIDAAHTTPEADEIARVMASMRAAGATSVAMEVSSIALALGRVRAVRFQVAAFTNFTQDHLDFHGSMEEYAAAKALLFEKLAPGSAVLNVADPLGQKLARKVRCPLVRVSPRVGDEADVVPLSADFSPRGIEARLRTPQGSHVVRSRLVGRHNLENLVVAIGVACALRVDLDRALPALVDEVGAPGRLERCDGDEDDVTVLVDYAHTPDALARVLESVRASGGARIVCVFGCGGDRDPTKRGPMGEAAAHGADALVITNDNPRSEDPAAIARPIEEAVLRAGFHRVELAGLEGSRAFAVELDRASAIRGAVLGARPGDVVLLAGKGHEDYQIIGHEKRAFDDRVEAKRALALRRQRAGG